MFHHTPDNVKNSQEDPSLEEETIPPRFELGLVVVSDSALEALEGAGISPQTLLRRHASGDWGDLDALEKRANDLALAEGTGILSVYALPRTSERISVLTGSDRSVTGLILQSEYSFLLDKLFPGEGTVV